MQEQDLKRIHDRKAQISALQEELNTLQADAKLQMEQNGCTELTLGDYKVTYKEQTNHRFDTSRFKIEMAALYKKYLLESKTRVFRIKRCA